MCGRYVLRSPAEALAALLGPEGELSAAAGLPPRYNVAPSQLLPAVRSVGGRRTVAILRWGLVPRWAKDESIGNRLINARAETVAEKPSFREALRKRRCVVPADGFYEWQATGPKTKQPWLFTLAGGAPFAFAGLWERWTAPGTPTPLETFTILTTEANELVRPVHERMPVILSETGVSTWLDPSIEDPGRLLPLALPFSASSMEAKPVGRRVNDPRFDGAECLESPESSGAGGL